MSRLRHHLLILVALAVLLLGIPSSTVSQGSCSVFKTFSSNEILTSSDLNNSLSRVGVTNMIVTCIDDYSSSVAQMQTMTDPFPDGTESLATTLAGELERLRYQIAQITGRTQWYHGPAIEFSHSTSGFSSHQSAGYTWPTAFPTTTGRVLASTTGGTLSWAVRITGTNVSAIEIIRKTADETVNNSTTLQNDDALTFSLAANEVVVFSLAVFFDSSAVADLKTAWSLPAGAAGRWGGQTAGPGGNRLSVAIGTALDFDGAGAGSGVSANVDGVIRNSTTAGTATLQWAQNTAEASDTKVLTDSHLKLWRQ